VSIGGQRLSERALAWGNAAESMGGTGQAKLARGQMELHGQASLSLWHPLNSRVLNLIQSPWASANNEG